MHKFVIALTLVVLAACSSPPISTTSESKTIDSESFTTIDAAATGALKVAIGYSTQYERGGGILLGPDHQYHFTIPVGGNNPGEVRFELQFPKSYKLVALYHTHPSDVISFGEVDTTEYFSEVDIKTAKELHITSYIGIIKNYTVARFIPGVDAVSIVGGDVDMPNVHLQSVSLGETVGPF